MQTLNPPASLVGSHLRTYERIFQHPLSHNLAWRDVLALFNHLGEVVVELNGHLKVTLNGHALVLPSPRTKDVTEVDEVMRLRFFLGHSGVAASESDLPSSHLLLVIDHQVARLFRTEMHDDVPQQILPHEAADHFHHAHEARDFFSGKEKPAPHIFFEAVATALKGASRILIFGTGTGTSSEMDQFTAWLKQHHSESARRIIGTVVIDERHLTEPELLAKAREIYAHSPLLKE